MFFTALFQMVSQARDDAQDEYARATLHLANAQQAVTDMEQTLYNPGQDIQLSDQVRSRYV